MAIYYGMFSFTRSSANAERSLMDDWVIMCDNKWMFKRIIKKVFCILLSKDVES